MQNEMEKVIRSNEHSVKLSNQEIVELAYLFRDYIEEIGGVGVKLDFERTSCNLHVLSLISRLIRTVDAEYLEHHAHVRKWIDAMIGQC